jgi:hypothetical protein
MYKILAIAIFIGGAIFCSALPSWAQEKAMWADMQFIRQSEVWLMNNNAAGLKYLPVDTISEISLNRLTLKKVILSIIINPSKATPMVLMLNLILG